MHTTKLLYMDDFNQLQCDAHIVEILHANEKDVLILDQTVFYPQGGGQPYDQGKIISPSARFSVQEVRFVDEHVKHIGKIEQGTFTLAEKIHCEVNAERRLLNSRLHSAGHVVDLAVQTLHLPWAPGKGYHFPDSPYVEYLGNLDGVDKEKLKMDLENLCNQFIEKDKATTLLFVDKKDLASLCHFVPDYIPENKPTRVVKFDEFAVPCGGTHVKNLSALNHMTIRKIKMERGNIRVSYDVVR